MNNVLDFKFSFKLDTGSNYTVVGIDMLDKEIIEYLIKNCTFCNNDSALDATDNKLRMFKLNVCAFYLTPDVCLNNLELFFSPDLHSKAILGMDILSLFEFKYIHEKKQRLGTFYLIEPKKVELELYNDCTKLGKVIKPRNIMLLDDLETTSKYSCLVSIRRTKDEKQLGFVIKDKITSEVKEVSYKELKIFLLKNNVDNVSLTLDNKIKVDDNVNIKYI